MTPGNGGTPLSEIACNYTSDAMSPSYSPSIFSFETSPRPKPTPVGGAEVATALAAAEPSQMSMNASVDYSVPMATSSGGGGVGIGSAQRQQRAVGIGMDEIAGINSIADTPGMCSPGLQKSLIALGVVGEGMPGLYDLVYFY